MPCCFLSFLCFFCFQSFLSFVNFLYFLFSLFSLFRWYSGNLRQHSIKGDFFSRKGSKCFTAQPLEFNPFLSVSHQSKALYNFYKRGQCLIVEHNIGLEYPYSFLCFLSFLRLSLLSQFSQFLQLSLFSQFSQFFLLFQFFKVFSVSQFSEHY